MSQEHESALEVQLAHYLFTGSNKNQIPRGEYNNRENFILSVALLASNDF